MSTVDVSSQAELDREIELGVQGVWIDSDPSVRLVVARTGVSHVEVRGVSDVLVGRAAQVTARDVARVFAGDRAHVVAYGSAYVEAWGRAFVEANDAAHVVARDSAQVSADDSSRVEARGSARVYATASARVFARGKAQVEARDGVQVTARGFAAVTAWHHARVDASTYVRVFQHSTNALIVGGQVIDMAALDERDLNTWMDMHGVTPVDGKLVLYKAVGGDLRSDHDFLYPIGETVAADDWEDSHSCGGGLHLSPTVADAVVYAPEATRFLECTVDVADVRSLHGGTAKLKAPRVTVVREVDRWGEPLAAPAGGVPAEAVDG